MRRSRLASALVVVAALLGSTLTACGDDDSGAMTDHNGADVSFVSEMIPHHQQAVEMVEMTESRDLDPDFVALAQQIKDGQQPEIPVMQGWLDDWSAAGEGEGEDDSDDGMNMGGDMAEMMSSEQMAKLADSPDGSFRRLWLQSMIEHHQGALGMARSEAASGKSPDARALAQRIEDTQSAEITEMRSLLAN